MIVDVVAANVPVADSYRDSAVIDSQQPTVGLALERPGLYEVSASSGPGNAVRLRNVRVDQGECHVIPVHVTLILPQP